MADRTPLSRSVRFRITAVAALLAAAVLAVLGVATIVLQRTLLLDALDDRLQERAGTLASLLLAGQPVPVSEGAWQLVQPDGVVAASNDALRGQPPIGPLAEQPERFSIPESDRRFDDAMRVLSQPVATDEGTSTLHVIGELEAVEESTALLTTAMLVVFPLAVTLLVLVLWRTVGRTLGPVARMRAEVAEIQLEDLHRRVPRTGTGDELDQLAATMNSMLDRLEAAVVAQRRFVGDASHELRTPVTRLRAALEAGPDQSGPDALLDEMHREVVRLAELIDNLLMLARLDEGRSSSILLDLDEIVLRAAENARATAAVLRGPTTVTVDTTSVSGGDIRGDAVALTRAVENLLDNAVRHADSRVTVLLHSDDDGSTLSVEDDGPGIPTDLASAVFERFMRLDDARSADGVGLGLAIVRDVVRAHGGSVEVTPAAPRGARFTLRLPSRDDPGNPESVVGTAVEPPD